MTSPALAAHPIGWDDEATARYFEAFCVRHARYAEANQALVERADLRPGQRVLDLGAGIGGTAEAALSRIGETGRIVCAEPSAAMRSLGRRRVSDSRVEWQTEWPGPGERFDRVLCGAGIWQMLPLEWTFARISGLLTTGGALVFNIPGLYLGQPDAPGGGDDPQLLELPALLARRSTLLAPAGLPGLPDAAAIARLLGEAGLRPEPWGFRVRLIQAAYRDWLKIPLMTNYLLPDLDADERAARIDAAFTLVDPHSWRWEAWLGWTAWR